MKIKLILCFFLSQFCNAQTVYTGESFASPSSALESDLANLNNITVVDIKDVVNVNNMRFAVKVTLPDGIPSLIFTSATFTITKVAGNTILPPLINGSLNQSKLNLETGDGTPNIFVRNASGQIIPLTGNMVGTAIPNPKTIFITEHRIALGSANFPKLSLIGDEYEITYTLLGNGFSVSIPPAKIVAYTLSDITYITVSKVASNGGTFTINNPEVNEANHLKSFWIEKSTDQNSWSLHKNVTFTSNTTITLPTVSGGGDYFWKIATISVNQ